MTVNEIRDILRKKTTIFKPGGKGKYPTDALLESWIGSVNFKLENEEFPTDESGQRMTPLAMIFLKGLTDTPKALEGIELLSIFMLKDTPDGGGLIGDSFVIRKYSTLDNLVRCRWMSAKGFPLYPELKEDDFPSWESFDIPDELEEEIVRLQNEGEIEYCANISEKRYFEHKVGGYPSLIQPGGYNGDGYEFVLQIVSDDKVGLEIMDGGNFYFYYNPQQDKWEVYCDCY